MKARLMHPDRDFDPRRPLPPQAAAVRSDLALDVVVGAMAGGDDRIADVAGQALLNAAGNGADVIRYRQAIVADAIANPEPVRSMYALAEAALEEKRKSYWGFTGNHPSSVLYSALHVLRMFMRALQELRGIAEAEDGHFKSAGFGSLFSLLRREFDDAYLARVAAQLDALEFKGGALVSAALGPAAESECFVLRRPRDGNSTWWHRLLGHAPSAYTVHIAQRDLIGAKTLQAMRDRGVGTVADALAQSVEHIQGFFEVLRTELAFHVGCVNLHDRLVAKGIPVCFPEPVESVAGFAALGLRDVPLVLQTDAPVTANDVDATTAELVVITGANQGGKSTFLRSLGLVLLMLEAGMFVTAERFAAAPGAAVFTHYKREEDVRMRQGKLDEELARISSIADSIRPGAWLLSNESFASTNEREGSELAHQMVDALLERRIRVVCVTHLYTFARDAYRDHCERRLFLRAERLADGIRTYRLREGAPQQTSYGMDLYRNLFGDAVDAMRTTPPAVLAVDAPNIALRDT